jgi:hypothetical protein
MEKLASPEEFPTPVARVAIRAQRATQHGRAEEFLSLGYLSEVFMKYTALVLHSCARPLDQDSWKYWGYRLARADGLGDWDEALAQLEVSARTGGAGGWLREILDWLGAKRTGKREVPWFSEAHELAQDLWALARAPATDYQQSVRGLMSFLVSLRNRTRGHGAFPPDFYDQASPLLEGIVSRLLENAPWRRARLLWYEAAPDATKARVLTGPHPTEVEQRDGVDISGLALEAPGNEWTTGFSPLLQYRPADDACFFANGRWQSDRASCEGLDYLSGDRIDISLPQFTAPPAPKPRSETAGGSELISEIRASHNLPSLAEGYVQREALQDRVMQFLTDRQHRIITLHGMGGVGKTSLALRVGLALVRDQDCPFDLVLWFSARDLDLLVEGPQPREREVKDIEEVAQMYCRMLGGTEGGREALDLFASEVADPSNKMLLIMDNFETLDDPQGVHEYLDGSVVMPNKVLITSRLRAFKGDYPMEVSGMESNEAADLLRMEARRVGCEPKMTPEAMDRIYAYAGGVPYAMKLIAAQMGRNIPLSQILDASVGGSHPGRVVPPIVPESERPSPTTVLAGG